MTVESLLGIFGVEDPVEKPNIADSEFGAAIIDDLLDGVLLGTVKEDLLERLANEFFLDFVVFKVVFNADVRLEAIDGVDKA